MIPKAVLTCIIFWCIASFAQNKCGLDDTTVVPGAIFGPDHILRTGCDTINTPAGRKLIYSCWEGQIVCTKGSKILWTSALTGRLVYLRPVPGKKIKGCDMIFQYYDKRIFALNSRNGYVKPISESDIILSLPRIGSRRDRKRMYQDVIGPFRKS